jgi:hypothetical protein
MIIYRLEIQKETNRKKIGKLDIYLARCPFYNGNCAWRILYSKNINFELF